MGRVRFSPEQIIGKLRDALPDAEVFDALLEARMVIEAWGLEYNRHRPHSSLGYRPPAPEAIEPRKLSLAVVQ